MIRAALLAIALGWIVALFGADYVADPMCYACHNSTADWVFVAAKGP